jgi:site-specific recombinase XerC
MYPCGLRISEVTTLEAGAVDRANQVLRIIGKCLPPRKRAMNAAALSYARCSVLRRKPVRCVALAIRNAASAPDRMKRAPISI